jgi:hypothetical protein
MRCEDTRPRIIRTFGSTAPSPNMKSNHAAFVFIVVVMRLTAIYLVLELIYSIATTSLTMPSGMGSMISGFMFRVAIFRLVAALVLWFIARPVGKLVLSDINST